MLFIADRHLANSPAQSFMREARVDKSIIRVVSTHKWPERVVFDTNLPTIIPSPPPVLASAPIVNKPREALAQLVEPSRPVSKPSEHYETKKVRRKVANRARPARMAAYRAAPETFPGSWW
jgi:hypothetical protein